jgi:hypothetical protein
MRRVGPTCQRILPACACPDDLYRDAPLGMVRGAGIPKNGAPAPPAG